MTKEKVFAVTGGEVRRVRGMYNANNPNVIDKLHFKFIQIKDNNGADIRYEKVEPCVNERDIELVFNSFFPYNSS
jgi:hypothetical protein